jgi:hypothetical protein
LNAPDSLLEYKQVNLANKVNHEVVFAPPSEWAGQPTGWVGFDVVYDLTGETGFDKPELVGRRFLSRPPLSAYSHISRLS